MTQQYTSALIRGLGLAVATALVGLVSAYAPNAIAPGQANETVQAIAGVVGAVLTVFVGRFVVEGTNDTAKATSVTAATTKPAPTPALPSESEIKEILDEAASAGVQAAVAAMSAGRNPNSEP